MGVKEARIKLKRDTTVNWDNARGFIPLEGELIVYNDYATIRKIVNGNEQDVVVPAIKIGDGRAYVQDLPFVNDELRDQILNHINNPEIHVTKAEKLFWNNKININDSQEVIDGVLIFNRN